jgi:hypothetical protein
VKIVIATETPSPDVLGEFDRHEEDMIVYTDSNGETSYVPFDCAAIVEVDVSHLPNA